MDIFFRVQLAKPESMSLGEFFDVWIAETEAVLAAREAGVIQWVHKVSGQYEVVGVMTVDSAEHLDELMHGLPVWRNSASHTVVDMEWLPVGSYEAWSQQMKRHNQQLPAQD